MEIKKSPKANLETKRGLFLEIGLAVSLALVVLAFSYTPKEHRIEKMDMGYAPIEMEMMEITRQDDTPPPPPQKVSMTVMGDMLQIVANETQIEQEITFDEFDDDMQIEIVAPVEEEIIEEEIFVIAETMASFQGGDLNTFRAWVQSRLKYPAIAAENGISGKVIIKFVIEKDGSLSNIDVLRSPDASLSEEAVRVLKTSPKWSPARQRDKAVRLTYTLPVDFRLQE